MGTARAPFHRGEKEIQARLGVRDEMERRGRRLIRDHMPEEHRKFFSSRSFLVIGTVDACARPWASMLAGEPGFVRTTDARTLEVKARPIFGDPSKAALVAGADIGVLAIEFHTRRRIRANGRITRTFEDGFELRVEQSYDNGPRYIQDRRPVLRRDIATIGQKRPVRRGKALDRAEATLIAGADTLFIASQFSGDDGVDGRGVDVSHRGGRPGFVVVAHETLLLFPDYAGNGMFNTLGNIAVNANSGLLFVDFDSGDTLQVTGEAEILWAAHHVSRFPGAERVVAFRVEQTLHIEAALPFAWQFHGYSPVLDRVDPLDIDRPTDDAHGPMKLLSVNVSMPKAIVHRGKTVSTGIVKQPVPGRVMLHRLNLEGDGQADLWGHGGAFRAVYVYSVENYAHWEGELGRKDLIIGQFGENFTVEGMLDDDVHVGDVLRVGNALVEVSQPRIPCYKLAIRIGIEAFQNRFLASGRVGFYCRVLQEGDVGAGDVIELVERDRRAMTVREINDLLYFGEDDLDATRKALQIPALSHGWKGSFEERLAKAAASPGTREGWRRMVVDRKAPESETITSFYLVPEDGAPLPAFLPGQFLTFELTIPGQPKPTIRTYTASDSPHRDYYRVSIKREPAPSGRSDLPAGLSSSYFHDQVEVGAALHVGAPRGKFHLDPDGERAVVLLSAGVGLTPMISMLNAIVETGSMRLTWFIHGARNGREHAMGAHVRRLAAENDDVHVHIRYSSPDAVDVEGRDYDSRGHIDMALLKHLLPFDAFDFYLCGPTAFMRSLYCGLLALDVPEDRIHYEFFGPASVLKEGAQPTGRVAEVPTADAEVTGGIEVTFARSGVVAAWTPDCESILDLAERHGLNPDYSCRSGICHTCMCELIEGEVEYLEQPLAAPDPGCVLICCSRPKSKLVIEV